MRNGGPGKIDCRCVREGGLSGGQVGRSVEGEAKEVY